MLKLITKNETGAALILELVLVAVVIIAVGLVGYRAYHKTNSNPPTTSSPSASSNTTTPPTAQPLADPTKNWTKYTDSLEALTFKYPVGWQASAVGMINGASATKTSGPGTFNVNLSFTGSSGIGGQTTGWVASDEFTFSGTKAYLILSGDKKYLAVSSCAAPTLCPFKAKSDKNTRQGLNIQFWTEYYDGTALAALPQTDAVYKEASQILKTLSY